MHALSEERKKRDRGRGAEDALSRADDMRYFLKRSPSSRVSDDLRMVYLNLMSNGASERQAEKLTGVNRHTWVRMARRDPNFSKMRSAAKDQGTAKFILASFAWCYKALEEDSKNAPYAHRILAWHARKTRPHLADMFPPDEVTQIPGYQKRDGGVHVEKIDITQFIDDVASGQFAGPITKRVESRLLGLPDDESDA